ncbi:MAG TPA: hypothetical protein VGK73_32745 [Polyangiaceae bacterium]
MEHLLAACIDDQTSLLAAAAVLPADQGDGLRDVVRRRGVFRAELATHIGDLGGSPPKHGSLRPHLRAIVQRVNRALVGGTDGDAYRGLAAAASRTEALYAKTLRRKLPPDARVMIARQYREISDDQSDFRRRQWSGPGVVLGSDPTATPALQGARTAATRGPKHLAQWADDGGVQPVRTDVD